MTSGAPKARRWLVTLPNGPRRVFRSPEAYATWVAENRVHHEVRVLAVLEGGNVNGSA